MKKPALVAAVLLMLAGPMLAEAGRWGLFGRRSGCANGQCARPMARTAPAVQHTAPTPAPASVTWQRSTTPTVRTSGGSSGLPPGAVIVSERVISTSSGGSTGKPPAAVYLAPEPPRGCSCDDCQCVRDKLEELRQGASGDLAEAIDTVLGAL